MAEVGRDIDTEKEGDGEIEWKREACRRHSTWQPEAGARFLVLVVLLLFELGHQAELGTAATLGEVPQVHLHTGARDSATALRARGSHCGISARLGTSSSVGSMSWHSQEMSVSLRSCTPTLPRAPLSCSF